MIYHSTRRPLPLPPHRVKREAGARRACLIFLAGLLAIVAWRLL